MHKEHDNGRLKMLFLDDAKEIVVEKSAETATYDDFLECLPENEPRYAVYDFDYEKPGEGQRSKITFYSWYVMIPSIPPLVAVIPSIPYYPSPPRLPLPPSISWLGLLLLGSPILPRSVKRCCTPRAKTRCVKSWLAWQLKSRVPSLVR